MEKNKIYNLDCRIGLDSMAVDGNFVDLCLTSPPYNIIRKGMSDRGYDVYSDGVSNDTYVEWLCSIMQKVEKVLKPNGCILLNLSYGGENTECMHLAIADIIRKTTLTVADVIVWEKPSAFPENMSPNKLTRICEFVYVICRKSEINSFYANKLVSSVRKTGQATYGVIFNRIRAKNNDEICPLNKATFSTELCYRLFDIYAPQNAFVLDPFMGTGTTAVACAKRNYDFIGFELSEEQCKWADKRIDNLKAQTTIFDLEN